MKKLNNKQNTGLEKAQRYARTDGFKGWALVLAFLAAMCFDQFVIDLPFENIVFPLLVIAAATLTPAKNAVLVAVYSVIFELSCIAWFIWDLPRVPFWLLEVTIGYFMPFVAYKIFNRGHKNISVFGYAGIAAFSELLYYWVSVIATCLIWKVPFVAYFLSDVPYEALGCAATFVCTLPVAAVYKLISGELKGAERQAPSPLSVIARG